MMRLGDIKLRTLIQGLEPDEVVRIITSEPIMTDVPIDKDDLTEPYYIRKPFAQEQNWALTSINMDNNSLITKKAGKTI
ncbi:MAG: hypothetical protein PHT37_07900 [Candidatus Cloacimonetes bacterium]|jgi:hypothetical protein|nr:hypothetical protein [Candidatus Cloacimonadota bacterium]MDD2423314.1 hypothetical protein [Candidatus Cloacimonadota bacterium]MDD3562494.1 hypothetical protein [Candidatus Cloacimonadota bacterium]MDD4277794.1 hypothetical protein [Candidatus Cloacimonadota bacterium]MDY0325042.1 hypothetical protein [Candidatus Cloacimonadaceae bacterium]